MKIIHVLAAGLLLAPAVAASHVTVWPKESTATAWEKYEFRLPNEKDVDTIALEVRFPTGVRTMSFEQKPGWMTEPVRDASGNIVGVRWTGKLAPHQFTEFGVIAVNPAATGELKWVAIQTYADSTIVEWSGANGSKTPAPRTRIKARSTD